ncbi:MAG TPA: metallophosphoesterase [Haliangiales bacterium]|nr:metallophosphoesterase [Haliangiales bacterium]
MQAAALAPEPAPRRPAPLPRADELPATIAFLLYFAYIDGHYDPAEDAFIARLAARDPATHRRVLERVTADLRELHDEAPRDAGYRAFVHARLQVRCLEIFRALGADQQRRLIAILDAFVQADGRAAPEELRLRDDLVQLLTLAPPAHVHAPARGRPMHLGTARENPPKAADHPFLQMLEHAFSPHPVELESQLENDYRLIARALMTWHAQRAAGDGRLSGVRRLADLPPGSAFLDGHTYALRPDPKRPLDLIVVGDLHGCYSCLKAVLLQSDFFRRVYDHQRDPLAHPDVKLVFLGDYIDRGRFSFDGVLRTALQLFVAMPDYVCILRGNHEHFQRGAAGVASVVWPAEAIATLAPHAPAEMLEAYRVLFEGMPSALVCDRTLYVHGGIPRDDTLAERWRDLSSLNDPDIRFQMMWSDPAAAEHVPVELQRQNPRFSFGRQQFRAFMERVGCQTLVRGHEKVDGGFQATYDLGDLLLLTLFSAGGAENADLPAESSYRRVQPMALSVRYEAGSEVGIPWPIAWGPWSSPVHNGFLRELPELAFRIA